MTVRQIVTNLASELRELGVEPTPPLRGEDKSPRGYLSPMERRAVIVRAARWVLEHGPERKIPFTLRMICDNCDVPTSVSCVKHYFGTLGKLRAAAQGDPMPKKRKTKR
jgi:hypothetical protein